MFSLSAVGLMPDVHARYGCARADEHGYREHTDSRRVHTAILFIV